MKKQAAHEDSILVQNRILFGQRFTILSGSADYPSQSADERRTDV